MIQIGRYILRWTVLIVLGLLVYGRTFGFDFVYDDHEFIVHNPYIRSFGELHGLWTILPKTRLLGIYSFALNYHFSRLHPQAYHMFNFVVHLLATGLVWALSDLLWRITAGKKPQGDWLSRKFGFIAALIFLVHPCQTQAVAYISQRFESMAALFYLAAVYAYLKGRLGPQCASWFVLAAGCGLLGLMTKETAVTIPVMLLAAEWILPLGKGRRAAMAVLSGVVVCFGLLLMQLVHTGLHIFAQTMPSESHDGDVITVWNYLLTQMRVFLTFVRLLVFPAGQKLDYDYPLSVSLWQPPLTFIGLAVLVAMFFFMVRSRQRFPLAAFGVAWMLITFSINLVPRPNVIWEHKLYLISFGFILTVVDLGHRLIRPRALLSLMFGAVIIVLAVAGFHRNAVWRNNVTLWEDAMLKSPHKARVYANLGWAYGVAGMYDDAAYFLHKAVVLNPGYYKNYMNLGDIDALMGRNEEALKDFNRALDIDPLNSDVYVKRARIYKRQKDDGAALADLDRSISLKPNVDAYLERGLLEIKHNDPQRALEDMQNALGIEPENPDALIDRAGVYFCMRRFGSAIRDLDRAQELNPGDFRIYKNRAFCYLALGQKTPGLEDMQASLRLNPNDLSLAAKYRETVQMPMENPLPIAERIFKNECDDEANCLIEWNVGEDFLSLGLGHFIWYPKDDQGIFRESFKYYVQYARNSGATIPVWLNKNPFPRCPWSSRKQFLDSKASVYYQELLGFMKNTKFRQAEYLFVNAKSAFQRVIDFAPDSQRARIAGELSLLSSGEEGLYAMIDYVNFKGSGVEKTERYQGQGWGLLQVLQGMRDAKTTQEALVEFVKSAKKVLRHRVSLAPLERHEERWLPGWLNRIDGYLEK